MVKAKLFVLRPLLFGSAPKGMLFSLIEKIEMISPRKETYLKVFFDSFHRNAHKEPFIPGEIWRELPGNLKPYAVSNLGRVRSKKVCLKTSLAMNSGYAAVTIKKNELVHRLVWVAFRGEIPRGRVINHKNGVKLDNRLSNLECVSYEENSRHALTILGY